MPTSPEFYHFFLHGRTAEWFYHSGQKGTLTKNFPDADTAWTGLALSRSKLRVSIGESEATVQMPNTAEPASLFTLSNPTSRLWLRIYRLKANGDPVVRFVGRVVDCEREPGGDPPVATLRVAAIQTLLDRVGPPHKYSPTCPWQTYSTECGADENGSDASVAADAVPDGGNTGTGDITREGAGFDAPTETWTIECTAVNPTTGRTTWTVDGSVSGSQAGFELPGTASPITFRDYDNDLVRFRITRGGTNYVEGDIFTIDVDEGNPYKITVPVSGCTIAGNTISHSDFATVPSGWFTQGWVRNGADRAFVVSHVGAKLTLLNALIDTAQDPDIVALAGDDHTFGTCVPKFNQGVNFRGFRHMPDRNPVTDGF